VVLCCCSTDLFDISYPNDQQWLVNSPSFLAWTLFNSKMEIIGNHFPSLFLHSADEQDSDSFSGGCEYTYLIWMAVFALVVLPFSLLNLTDQVYTTTHHYPHPTARNHSTFTTPQKIIVQVSMCVLRIVAMATILITVCVAMGTRPYDPDSPRRSAPYVSDMATADFTGSLSSPSQHFLSLSLSLSCSHELTFTHYSIWVDIHYGYLCTAYTTQRTWPGSSHQGQINGITAHNNDNVMMLIIILHSHGLSSWALS